MITERTLKKWRKESLKLLSTSVPKDVISKQLLIDNLNKKIIRMTQELLDQHLLRRKD